MFFLWEGVADDARESMRAQLSPTVTVEKGALIYGGDEGKMGFLVEGRAQCRARNGNVLMRTFCEGDVFGAAALFGMGAMSEVWAEKRCIVQYVEEELLLSWFRDYPVTAVNYIRFLSGRVRFLNRKIEMLSMDSASSRLMQYLCSHAGEDGRVETGSMSDLAKTLGIGRTSLYRSLDELSARGFLERVGHNIILKEDPV